MSRLFGTDGIRGIVDKDLTYDMAFNVGRALGTFGKRILIGRDTRLSGKKLTKFFANGVMFSNLDVLDVGVIPTPGISYLTKLFKFDFGVMITASHNRKNYNGIKIFDSFGNKISVNQEKQIEELFFKFSKDSLLYKNKRVKHKNLQKFYQKFLLNNANFSLKGVNILLDSANGSAFKIAPKIFKKLGANVKSVNCKNDGEKINENCGALYAQNLKNASFDFDLAFAFDGDADRLVALDKKGNIIDGDRILLIFAKYFNSLGKFKIKQIVATQMSNLKMEEELNLSEITLLRTDVGDKNVCKKLKEKNLILGGEQSGHIILPEIASTGDGILTALILCKVFLEDKEVIEEVMNLKFYPQILKNINVKQKNILRDEQVLKTLDECEQEIFNNGRLYVRESGTEPKIRILVESLDHDLAKSIINKLKSKIMEIEN